MRLLVIIALVLVGFYFLVLQDGKNLPAKCILFCTLVVGVYYMAVMPWYSWTMILMVFYFLVLIDKKNMLAKGLLFGAVVYGMNYMNMHNKANLSGTMIIADVALGATLFGTLGYLALLVYKIIKDLQTTSRPVQ
jgi:hypothetical protein